MVTALECLVAARATGRPCPPVRALLPAGDVAAAYAVQSAWVAARVAAGAVVVGRKVGLTNPAVQAQLGVDQPDFGVLLDTMDCPPGVPVDIARTMQPKIEAEIAFVLSADLTGADIGPAEVVAATGWVAAALEIVDSRIAGWDIDIVDTVADNASSGLFTLGERRRLAGLDLRACGMTMWRGDEVVSRGAGAACLGDPLLAAAWLARTAREFGQPLRAGDIVLSGALGPMVPVAAGDRFHAEIDGFAPVTAEFTGGPMPLDVIAAHGSGPAEREVRTAGDRGPAAPGSVISDRESLAVYAAGSRPRSATPGSVTSERGDRAGARPSNMDGPA